MIDELETVVLCAALNTAFVDHRTISPHFPSSMRTIIRFELWEIDHSIREVSTEDNKTFFTTSSLCHDHLRQLLREHENG